jgi:hypothetical protein
VTCVVIGKDGATVVTGSRDCTLRIWDIIGDDAAKASHAYGGRIHVNSTPRHILRGHEDEIIAVAIDTELDLCVSVSSRGICLLHSLRRGRLLRRLSLDASDQRPIRKTIESEKDGNTSSAPSSSTIDNDEKGLNRDERLARDRRRARARERRVELEKDAAREAEIKREVEARAKMAAAAKGGVVPATTPPLEGVPTGSAGNNIKIFNSLDWFWMTNMSLL